MVCNRVQSKIVEQQQLQIIARRLRQQGRQIAFTNGCFDLLHIGHIRYLNEACKYGDVLVVALNSDRSVARLKGEQRPIVNQEERREIMASLEMVDYVTVFEGTTCTALLRDLQPEIYVKGGDYTPQTLPEWPVVRDYGGRLELVELIAGSSTTDLIKKIKGLPDE
ncbi:MAG: D-glycero-beta-D-manno-heptose 1-phosphate adenylyltransferase [Bacillota bacterium]